MAVIGLAQELPESLAGEFTETQFRFERHFLVQCSDKYDGQIIVCNAPGLPLPYSSYLTPNEFSPFAINRRRHAEKLERTGGGIYLWKVILEYDTPEPRNEKGGGGHENTGEQDNPLLAAPTVRTYFDTVEKPIYYQVSATGTVSPLQTSAGQVYDPTPTIPTNKFVLEIERNEPIISGYQPALAALYQNKCNSDTFWGIPAPTGTVGQCFWKCKTITTETQRQGQSSGNRMKYLKTKYIFELDDHYIRLLDSGDYFLDPSGVFPFPFKDSSGNNVKGLLDGNGGDLPPNGTPVYNSFLPYGTLPFAALNLPNDLTDCEW